MRKIKPEFNRFISKVVKTDNCWLWIGSTYRFGYGHFRRKINGKWIMYKAHRYSYEYFKGQIPKGMLICHTCDNPACVNPNHLYSGTHKDNVDDMFSRNRKSRLIRNPKHNLLSMEIAREIRKLKSDKPAILLREISVMFSTSLTQVSRILNNKIWQEEN